MKKKGGEQGPWQYGRGGKRQDQDNMASKQDTMPRNLGFGLRLRGKHGANPGNSALTRFIALIIKEFHSVWRDPKSRSLLFLPPILQLFIFSHAATLDIQNIEAAVLCEDNTPVAREFLSRVSGSRYFKKLVYVKNRAELREILDREAVRGAIHIKNDFTKKYLHNDNPEIQVILDGRHTNGSQIIGTYISQIAADFEGAAHVADTGAFAAEGGAGITTRVRNWYNPNLYYHWFIISSLAGILSLSMVVLLSALSLAREKETGTFDEILVSPLKPYEIVFGKLVVPLFFGVIDGIFILFAAKFIFGMPFVGNFFLYMFALIIFLASVSGVGLFISSICKTQQQAMLGVFVFMFPCLILSGYSAPVENITPEFLQKLTVINPLRFFLIISKGIILKNVNLLIVMKNLIPIIFITIFTLFAANYSFKNKLD